MKKYIIILMIGILAFMGCEDDEGPDLSAPQNLTLTLWDNGAGLKIDWDAVSNANAYYIYFGYYDEEDSLQADCKVISPTFHIHDSVDIPGGGYYAVLAVAGEYDEVVGPMSEIVRSASIKTEEVIMYERDYDGGNSSAFGWDMDNGEGFVTSIDNTSDRWHFYLDDGTPGEIDSMNLTFVTPDNAVGTSEAPDVTWSGTYIVKSGASFAPKSIEGTDAPDATGIFKDFVFYLLIDDTYYAKLVVKGFVHEDAEVVGVRFDAYFQDMEEFRRF